MLFISIISLIVASVASRSAVSSNYFSPKLLSRLATIFLLYSAFISFNSLYFNNIGSGIGIYSGLFQITTISQSIETFIYVIGSLILIPWAKTNTSSLTSTSALKNNDSTSAIINISDNSLFKTNIMSSPIVSEYSLIILFTSLGASLLVSSSDLVSMYLSIELQSFAVYILATIYRDSESATSAGLKYFLLGGLSSCFILLGSGLIYSYTGLTHFESIYSLVSVSGIGTGLGSTGYENILSFANGINEIYHGYLLGLIFIVVGFLFKVSASPFHNWAPDVYDEVPTIVTTWLAIMPKISIFIFLLEIQSGLQLNLDALSIGSGSYDFNVFKNLLLISSLLSLIIGTVVGLAQSRIKRLFAYSTISHVGFLLLALGVNTEQSIDSFVFYIIQYTITNLNTFLILLAFGYIIYSYSSVVTLNNEVINNDKKNEKTNVKNSSVLSGIGPNASDINLISELKGQFFANPLLSISLSICLFSMAGIPPLIGFFSKQMVLLAAIQSGYYFLSIVAIVVSVISASYYLKIIRVLHFESPELLLKESFSAPTPAEASSIIQNSHSFIISSLTLLILLFILKPSLLLNSTHLLALTIFTS
jgi:NADH-ubiquinone oxidoreductase chain 2